MNAFDDKKKIVFYKCCKMKGKCEFSVDERNARKMELN